jgi:subtilisin family serine protease
MAVGSINAERFSENEVAFYSSQGPALYNEMNESGTKVQRVIQRKKPDIIGVDGVSVTGAGGFSRQFFGTSAAAPHIAGIAAQLMSVFPFVTAKNTHIALRLGARDIGPNGHDSKSGYGITDGLGALKNLILSNPMPPIMMLLNDEQD